jgi:tripartite-type tricarboxylate transporter receptor subunit TctC
MKLARRKFLHLAAGAVALPAISRVAKAQTYPTRPITIVVPYAAGGSADLISRVVAERMRRWLRQPIIVENVSGADGSIGTARVVGARPDGYTIVLGGMSTLVFNGALYSLPYDVLNSVTPISPLVTTPFVLLARKTMPANSLHELLDWLKNNLDKASAGIVSSNVHVVTAFFQKETGTKFTLVPYRGAAPAVQDLVAGQIDLAFFTPDQLPLARAGSTKAYAVTSDTRLARAQDIPTFREMGLPTVSYSGWLAFFGPKDIPKEIVAKLNAAAADALADSVVQSQLADLGIEIFPRERQTPEVLGALQRADAEKWWPIIQQLGISGSVTTVVPR